MDFDSTITEESTLMQIYMRLPEQVFRKAITISDEDYYKYESGIIAECYSKLRRILKQNHQFNYQE